MVQPQQFVLVMAPRAEGARTFAPGQQGAHKHCFLVDFPSNPLALSSHVSLLTSGACEAQMVPTESIPSLEIPNFTLLPGSSPLLWPCVSVSSIPGTWHLAPIWVLIPISQTATRLLFLPISQMQTLRFGTAKSLVSSPRRLCLSSPRS